MKNALRIDAAARELQCSAATLRRWIADGAPCVRPGEPGRGRGALVDLDAVRRWRAERAGILEQRGEGVDFDVIARGLAAAFRRGNAGASDPVWRELRLDSGRAAVILAEAFVSIHREITGREPDRYPAEVQTLHKCAVLPESRRRHFQPEEP